MGVFWNGDPQVTTGFFILKWSFVTWMMNRGSPILGNPPYTWNIPSYFLVGGDWNHGILGLSIQLGISSSQLTFLMFFRGAQPPTRSCFLCFSLETWKSFARDVRNSGRVQSSPIGSSFPPRRRCASAAPWSCSRVDSSWSGTTMRMRFGRLSTSQLVSTECSLIYSLM